MCRPRAAPPAWVRQRGRRVLLPEAAVARPRPSHAVAADESQKSAAVVGALLLGHQSSHQRTVRLTTLPDKSSHVD